MSGLSATDFALVAQMLKERSGLMLSPDKSYLLESRLTPIARKMGMTSLNDLVNELRTRRAESLMAEVTEAMTTNESFFYRDMTPFTVLRDHVLPQLRKTRASTRRLRIWCAAASTGQEPYSIAMVLSELGPKLAGWRIEILGTDLSTEVLEKAKAGVYTQFEVQRGLPVQLMLKYFEQTGDTWRIAPQLRAMVQYRPLNLLEDFRALGQFDIVFCRNVLIYFDRPTRSKVFDRIAGRLAPDGFLLLGGAESTFGVTERFVSHARERMLLIPAPVQKPEIRAVSA